MKIKTLTPVHISSGNKLTGLDFAVENGRVIVLDTPKLFKALEEKGCDLLKAVEDLGTRKISLKDLVRDFDLKLEDFKRYEAKLVGNVGSEISEQIKTNEMPYIPGSSIKGAIRTAILWYAVKNDKSLLDFAINHLKKLVRGQVTSNVLKHADDKLEKKVFGENPREDFMRVVRVTDSAEFNSLRVYEIKILGSSVRGVCVECIDENDTAQIEMEVDKRILEVKSIKSDLVRDIDTIAEITREFSLELIKSELNYNYDSRTKSILKEIAKVRGILLRVGWGTGWYSKTIGLLLETHPEFEYIRKKLRLGRSPRTGRFYEIFPKTRRTTADGKPLGWIKIDI